MHYTLTMVVDQAKVFNFLQESHLFRNLTDDQLTEMAGLFEPVHFADKQIIFKQGARSECFYLIYAGKVRLTLPGKKGARELVVLVPGDYCGEDLATYRRVRILTAIASGEVTLLKINSENFFKLSRKYKEFVPNLNIAITSRRLATQRRLPFLYKGEQVYLMLRKHPFFLWIRLIPWLAVLIIGLLVLLTVATDLKPVATYTLTCSAVWIVLMLAVIAWSGVDWGNDYYIVTNQRVIWLEKVVLLYDSRQETSLSNVLSVNVETSLYGRTFDYGNVVIRTYTGVIPLRHVGRPTQVASLVEAYWGRSKVVSLQEESAVMETEIKRRLGLLPEEPKPAPKPQTGKVKKTYKPGWVQNFFANFFNMRFEDQEVVTYRKHWYVLINSIWLQTILMAVLFLLLAARLANFVRVFSLPAFFGVDLFLFFIVFLWWFYCYWDWRNDIYQVTPDQILDIERKPLGRENKKSAPLENILSIEYERLGMVGLLLNYGTVTINIGAAKFEFNNVFNPSQVQQDIYRRMAQRIEKKKQTENTRDRQLFAEWIATYHRNAESLNQPPSAENPPEETPH